jgi:hypothetical protein
MAAEMYKNWVLEIVEDSSHYLAKKNLEDFVRW